MSLHITNFAHLVNSTKEQNKPEVTMSVSQASLVVTDIIELQNKLIATQEQLIKALEQNNAPTTGSADAGPSQVIIVALYYPI